MFFLASSALFRASSASASSASRATVSAARCADGRVGGSAVEDPHRRKDEDNEKVTVCADYFYLGTEADEKLATFLAMAMCTGGYNVSVLRFFLTARHGLLRTFRPAGVGPR